MLASIARDVAYALRMMRRSPGFTAAAVLSLCIGLGANTTIFGILDQLVWRSLPVPAPDRLVLLESDSGIGYRRFVALRDRLTGFDTIGAIWSIDRFNLQTSPNGASVDEVRIGLVSGDFFTTLGIAPMLGRLVSADDNRVPGAHPVAVVSFDFWERHFSGATTLSGLSVIVNDLRYDVIGVTPRGFSGEWTGKPTDLWVPFMMASQVMPEVPGGPNVFPARVLARLAGTTTIAEAEAAAGPVFLQLVTDEAGGTLAPGVRERTRLAVVAGSRGYSPQREAFSQPIAILIIAVSALLLIACANLANLLLARSAARQREMAVRLAIGAGRARVARQLLTESVVLSTTGGAAALIVAAWANRTLETLMASAPVSLAGQSGSLVLDLRVDWRAVVFMLGLSVVTGLVFGAAPARAAARASLSASLSAASARVVGRSRRFGPSGALVVVQVALSLLMLLGAGLLVRTLDNLRNRDLGYERQRELLVWTVPGQTGRQDVAMAELWRTVQQRLGELPGVASVAATNQSVLSGFIPEPGPGSISMRVEVSLRRWLQEVSARYVPGIVM